MMDGWASRSFHFIVSSIETSMRTIQLAFYLAFKELWRNRGRYFLVSLVIALITLLVLFIAALGEGLANGNRQYISNLDAQLIAFLDKSDYIISASRLESITVRAIRRVEGVEAAGPIYTSTTEIASTPTPLKVSLLAADPDQPGMPPIVSGRAFRSGDSRETVIDRNVALRTGIKIDDEIRIRSVQGTEDNFFNLKVVGLTDGQSYLFQPTIFVAPSSWEHIRPQSAADLADDTPYANIVAVRVKPPGSINDVRRRLLAEVANIQVADLNTTISNIPGYSAQQSTVQTQAVFTLLIGILVIGGFFQIQVLQKVPQIGVLKAIGSSNEVVGLAPVIQIIIVTAVGVAIGGGFTYVFSLGFPPTIPLVFNGMRSMLAVAALLLIGPVGGLVSVIYAVRIEPLKALRLQ